MNQWNLPVTHNLLQTKQELLLAFQQLSEPLLPYYSEGRAHLYVGWTGASYPDKTAGMEGFSRVLWGLIPALAGGGSSDLWPLYVQGIRNGTNPEHDEYWGEVIDYDQKAVEMAAFGFALALLSDKLKEELTEAEFQRLFAWLNQITSRKLWDCNWLFFRVMVQMGFKKAGLPYDREATEQTLDEIERFYLADGWYADGINGHSDYYVPFALHYYGLLYAKLMETEDPHRSSLYKERAASFAGSFIHWFAEDGSALPYGRSLAYRFSQSAFWSALVYAGVEPFPPGVMKGLILRNLRWWFQQPIFQADGTLTIGYAYPNLIMAENYNAPGSPYWAMKTFLPLALPDEHPFWQAEELPLPQLDKLNIQRPAHLVLCRDEASAHVLAFNTGHASSNEHTHTSAKYEKFVYSTLFGFSVPRAEWGLAQGAFDSMLALSEGDNLYRVKRRCEETSIDENGCLYTCWKPWHDVEVRTWLLPGTPWHVRIHHIQSHRRLQAADGGFALGVDQGRAGTGELHMEQADEALRVSNLLGSSGIRLLYGAGRIESIQPHSNTNLMHPRTVIPTVTTQFEPGSHWLVTAVYGEPAGEGSTEQNRWNDCPQLRKDGEELVITAGLTDEPAFRIKL
ncbi:DUF2264 domain-containing protein [Paenibacillus rigui]|uniref:DUF2264 domain-containing protein n=1 Tax=Paenibacillus rigui TaxID=554312 RepID=A0A229UVY7_9BACL|nr:DUF2264 domain-containing protein [Paenibacillus rigui]OXM87473.1 hypothetical protein CF651_05075 [Paenibacillus rigui]